MQKLVLDSDAYIKLHKSGILGEVCRAFECEMTREVYAEVVVAGAKHFGEQAASFQEIIGQKKIQLLKNSPPKGEGTLGKGEESVLDTCENTGTVAVSDDRRFLSLLSSKGITFYTPASLILSMHEDKLIDDTRAKTALKKLEPMIRREIFEKAMEEIGGD